MRFWMRRLSSGSVTSVQSSVFLVLDEEDLSFLELDPEPEPEDECLEGLDDMLDGSFSVSEPDWFVVAALLPLRLLRLFPEWAEGGASLLCLGVDR
jgi:hypothetical protein